MGNLEILSIYYQVFVEDNVDVYFPVSVSFFPLSSKGKFYALCLKKKSLRRKGCLTKKDKV